MECAPRSILIDSFSAAASMASTAIKAAGGVKPLPCRRLCVCVRVVCVDPTCRLPLQVLRSGRKMYREIAILAPQNAFFFRPAGASQMGELGLQTRKNRPIAEFLQPAKRLHRCSGSKKSVIYSYTS